MHRLADFERSNSPAILKRLGDVLRTDVLSSIIVFLVALPLCLGIAKACGLPPAVGLLTGIVGGLFVGTFSGSPLQVSGPAAGLIVLVAGLVAQYPGQEQAALGAVVLVAGAIQFTAGLLRLGQWFRAVAPAVIEGMLAGIGVLILASQFHIMIDSNSYKSGLENIAQIPHSIWKVISPSDDATHHFAALVGFVTIAVIVLWKLVAPKRLKIIPGPLLAVLIATGLSAARGLPIKKVELPDQLWDAIVLPGQNWLTLFQDPAIWTMGVTMALVASAETLLCASAIDQMHSGKRAKYDRELTAQGIGNSVCGLIGALPMTGVIVRSAANVEAGAKTRWSAVMHGMWLLLFVMLLPGALKLIPTACLAGILVYTGYKLVDVHKARTLHRTSRGELFVYLATLITIVATDLLTGVVTGIVLSALRLLHEFSQLRVHVEERPEHRQTVMYLEGAATFIRLPRLATALEQVKSDTHLEVHLDKLTFIDHACFELIMNWEKQHQAAGGTLAIDWGQLKARFKQRRRRSQSHHEVSLPTV